jgi:lipopolysaccharide transport protein LptA
MANSVLNRVTVFLAAALATGLLGVAAAAAEVLPREQQKIVLEAVPVIVDYHNDTAVLRDIVITQGDIRIEAAEAHVKGGLDFENGQWTISGNVRIKAETGNLRSDKAVVAFRDKLIARATITGSPAEFEQVRADGTTSRGHANTIDYETASGTVSLKDKAWLSDGCNEITGSELVYNIKQQSVLGQNNATPGGTGRIRITIPPKGASGTPCAAPAPEKKP